MARLLVFCTAAAVLVIEILAGRLLAPYFGVSLEVFTGIIGVILAGISAGAWAGGHAADRVDPTRLLGPLLVVGGLASLLAPLVVDATGPATSVEPISIVLVTALSFFLPAAALSAITPVVVKIRLRTLEETGSVVGGYSAVGTAGAIFGTFLTGFVLIAAFPTRPIVAAVGGALTVWGLVLWSTRSSWAKGLTLGCSVVLAAVMLAVGGPCEYETPYHCAQVVVDDDRPTGHLLLLDGVRNSYVDLADPTHLEFRYLQVMADVVRALAPPGPLDVLSVGGGGLTFPTYLETLRPGSSNIVLEIDPVLPELAREELGFAGQFEVRVGDARRTIAELDPRSYDLVVGDAFNGLSVPWHLTTREFVTMVAARLRADGFYVLNVIDYGERRFVRAELATLLDVFEHAAVIAPPEYLVGDAGGNYVLVGSDRPLAVERIEDEIAIRRGIEIVLTGDSPASFLGGVRPLVDDFAPVDQMIGR